MVTADVQHSQLSAHRLVPVCGHASIPLGASSTFDR
jgi:hypothetical protein